VGVLGVKMDLTKEERNAINALKRLSKRWPSTLWLFSGEGGHISVMKKKDGLRVYHGSDNALRYSADMDFEVDFINIESEGGAP